MTSTENVPGVIGGLARGFSELGAGRGPSSAARTYTFPVFRSTAIVRALAGEDIGTTFSNGILIPRGKLGNIPSAAERFHEQDRGRQAARQKTHGGSFICQRRALSGDYGQVSVDSTFVAIGGLIERAIRGPDGGILCLGFF